jgi:hypothetical protein
MAAVADFLCISPSTGDAINAAAAKELIKPKRLIFILIFPFLFGSTHKAHSPKDFVV